MKEINIKKVESFVVDKVKEGKFEFLKKKNIQSLVDTVVGFYNMDLCFHDKQSEFELGNRLGSEIEIDYNIENNDWSGEMYEEIIDFSVEVCVLLKKISQEEYPNNINIFEHGAR